MKSNKISSILHLLEAILGTCPGISTSVPRSHSDISTVASIVGVNLLSDFIPFSPCVSRASPQHKKVTLEWLREIDVIIINCEYLQAFPYSPIDLY